MSELLENDTNQISGKNKKKRAEDDIEFEQFIANMQKSSKRFKKDNMSQGQDKQILGGPAGDSGKLAEKPRLKERDLSK